MTHRATTFAPLLLLAATACTSLEDVSPSTTVTCTSASDCPGGSVCNRGRCTNPNAIDTTPPDIVGGVAVAPRPGQEFEITLQVTEALDGPPQVILALDPAVVLSCARASAESYACHYTATRAENGGQGGRVYFDVRMIDLAGNETVRNRAGSLELDFQAPVLAARSVEPTHVPAGGVIQVFFTTDEDLGASPVLVASRALDEPGDGVHLTPVHQPGTRNWLFTHLVTGADGAGPVDFTVDLVDAAGNAAAAAAVGRVVLDPVPPAISALAAAPGRLASAGTLTVTFDASEEAAPGTLAVTVGGRPMACGAWSEVSPSYTCTRAMAGDEIAPGTEAVQSVVVGLADPAGNRATVSGSAVFDFKAPALSARSAEPASVPRGGVIVVSFSPDEELGPSPVLVASRTLDEPGATRFTPARVPGTRTYQFTHVVTAQDAAGAVEFTVELADLVGNGGAGLPVGSVLLDPVAPSLTALAVSPARLGATGTLTVTFDATEAAAPGTLAVTVGGRAMSCGAWSATSPSYTCTRAMAGDELAPGIEAVQSVVVALADAAGNRATASGSTIFDFKAPALAGRSAGPSAVPLGGTIMVAFTPDEELVGSPVLVASRALDAPGGTRFPLAQQPGSRNYQFSHVVTGQDGAGQVDFTVELADAAGNAATGVAVGGVSIDNVLPVVGAVTAAPARLGATGTLTVTFDSTEAAAPGTLAVTVGGRPMSCGAWSATSPSYTCIRAMTGSEIATGTEAIQPVVVGLADVAGNRASGSASAVLDFKAPALAAGSAEPANVPLGGVIVVSLTPDEDLGASPVLVASRALGVPAATRFPLSPRPGTRNYLFTHLVDLADGGGTVEFTVELTDAVGNAAVGVPVGSVLLDVLAPLVSSVAAAPARLGRTGELRVTFDSSEAAAAGTLAVTVGGRAMACGAYAAASPSYTCTRPMAGSEIPAGVEAIQPVVVGLADAAGNRASGSASAVFDFKAPALAASSASPASVALGGTLLVTFTPDEDLGASPVLVASRALDEPGGTRFALAAPPGTRNYAFTHVVTQADGSGPVDFSVDLADAVGNATTAVPIGRVSTDIVPVTISGLAVTPARIRSAGTLTVTFDTNEAAAAGSLSVTVGGRGMTCGGYGAGSPRYTCTRPMAGDEIPAGTEAAQSVVVSLGDGAGNRSTASGSTVFDFRPPGVASASVAYTPAATNPLTTVTRAAAGTTVTVTVLANEALDLTFTPTLSAARGGTVLPFVYQAPPASTSTSAVFEGVVLTGMADGDYTPTLEWRDEAGNLLRTSADLPAVRVKTSAPTLVVNQAAVVFVRSPWGNAAPEDLGGYTIPGGAYFALDPPEPLSAATRLAAGTFLLDGGVVPEQILVRAGTMTVGTLRPDAGGTWPRRPLASPDTFTVEVVGVDDAGNASDPRLIGTVEWVATSNLPAIGTTPHTLLRTPLVEASRVQRTELDGVAEADVGGADGVAALQVAHGVWRNMTFPPPPLRPVDNAGLAYDGARGRVVMFGGRLSSSILQTVSEWDGRTWVEVTPPSGSPAARQYPALAYDGARGRVLLFGGATEVDWSTVVLGDTWEWDGTRWEEKAAGAAPPPRAEAPMAYDSARQRVVLFGGRGDGYAALGDTWEWDGTAWTSITPAGGSPGAGWGHGLAYDHVRGRTVLVTGAVGGPVWEWDGTSWTSIAPAGAAPGGSVIAYAHDGARGRVVLFASWWDGTMQTGVYEWDGASWTTVTIPAASPRISGYAVAHDAARARTVLVTGRGYQATDGTWEWDGGWWTNVTPTGRKPHPRYMYENALAYDSARRRMVLWGGSGAGDTWEWDGANWASVATEASSPPQWGSGLAYDAFRQRTMAVSGMQTWLWDGAAWTAVTPATQGGGTLVYDGTWRRSVVGLDSGGSWRWNGLDWVPTPSPETSGHAVFDSTRGRVVVVSPGGVDPVSEWDGNVWTTVAQGATVPPARWNGAMAFDSERGRAVLFGGMGCGSVCQDAWEWDGHAWHEATPPGTKPPARRFPSLGYDSARRRTVLFSGNDVGGDIYWDDTWELEAHLSGRPAIQLDVSTARTGIAPGAVRGMTVRARAGGAFTLGDPGASGTAGATLRGWATHSLESGPGGWVPLATNDAHAAAAPPYLGPPATTLLSWAGGAAEARRLITVRDGQLSFQVVPSGTMGPDPGGARVALDYVEVRVRYAAVP